MTFEVLHEICSIVDLVNKSIHYVRTQNYFERSRIDEKLMSELSIFISALMEHKEELQQQGVEIGQQTFLSALENLMNAYEKKDYILYGDYLELQLLPLLMEMQINYMQCNPLKMSYELYEKNREVFKQLDENLASALDEMPIPSVLIEKYIVEYSSSGYPTMAVRGNEGVFYLHSNTDPRREGFYWAQEHFGLYCEDYHVFGLGLGYHIQALLEKSAYATVTIYEHSIEMLKVASYYRDYSFLLEDRVRIQVGGALASQHVVFNEEKRFLTHNPSVMCLEDQELKQRLELFQIEYQSSRGRSQLLNHNYHINISQPIRGVDELRNDFQGKTVYMIAAGPSLDEDMSLLRNVNKGAIILATAAVLKKLLKQNIIPSYCIITDASEVVYLQTEGLGDIKVPLLYMSTVYYKVPQNYCGEKYIMFQKGFERAEEYAKRHGYTMVDTGGSVSTTAIDLCMKFGCKKIVCLGLDLAYPQNTDHAVDVLNRVDITKQNLIEVEDNTGGMVLTSRPFEGYRRWIERHITKTPHIPFINTSKNGAKIKGMKVQTLENVLQEEGRRRR